MKNKVQTENKKLLDLPEKEIKRVKKQLIEDGKIIETTKISDYDIKFFQAVLTSAVIFKFFIFFSFAVYALLNLSGVVISFINNSFNLITSLIQLAVCCAVLFICFAIFRNINTNRKTEREVIYVHNDNFIFNFNNGVVWTPKLFYCLPYKSLQKIEFEVYGIRESQVYGRVYFTFKILDYLVTHTINSANLTEIEIFFTDQYPSMLDSLVVDGKFKNSGEHSSQAKSNAYLYSLGCLLVSILISILPLIFNYFNLSLIMAGALLLLTAIIVFVSRFLYLQHLIQGTLLSCVFIIIGYLVPLFIILNSEISFITYIASNSVILLMTFFGNIGLCLYLHIIASYLNKLHYLIKDKHL